MCVCMYVCMYVCMHAGRQAGRHAWMYVGRYVCMHAYVHTRGPYNRDVPGPATLKPSTRSPRTLQLNPQPFT